ncbi:MAG: Asp-tRNA(Asn)/Glu-tRNA(Gln) amidotransferase subunit GatC [Bryobacteraceae bacterium]
MKITAEQVRNVAELANLRLTEGELERMRNEMDSILEHMDKLNELDTSGVEPMAQVLYDAGGASAMRDDVERQCLSNEEALANAPLSGSGMFKVPLVLER